MNPALDPRPRPRRSRIERRVTFALKVLALVMLGAYALSKIFAFAGRVHSVTIILVGAVFFSYMLYPLVRRLNERLPLAWSIAIAYLLIAVVAIFGIWIVVPALSADLQTLVRSMPALVLKAQSYLADSNNPLVARLPDWLRTYLESLVPSSLGFVQRYAAAEAANALAFLFSTFALIATVIVIPIISVYVMFEASEWRENLMRALPPRAHPRAVALLSDLDSALGGFIRGQLIVGAIVGSLITIVLLATHVRYAVLIGVAAALFNIIPYFGSFVAFIPATLIALVNDGWQHALIVAALIIGIFQLEGHVISPRVQSESVGLSPLAVIVAILVGGDLLGLAGMFLAVPAAAILRVIALNFIPGFRRPAVPAVPVPAEPAVAAPKRRRQGASV